MPLRLPAVPLILLARADPQIVPACCPACCGSCGPRSCPSGGCMISRCMKIVLPFSSRTAYPPLQMPVPLAEPLVIRGVHVGVEPVAQRDRLDRLALGRRAAGPGSSGTTRPSGHSFIRPGTPADWRTSAATGTPTDRHRTSHCSGPTSRTRSCNSSPLSPWSLPFRKFEVGSAKFEVRRLAPSLHLDHPIRQINFFPCLHNKHPRSPGEFLPMSPGYGKMSIEEIEKISWGVCP